VIGNFTYVLDPSADLTEPTSEQVIALARFTLRGIGDILRDEYGDEIQGFSATIDETDTDLVENLYTLLFDATILFRPCAPPSDEVNTIFEGADYNAILSGFEPEGADNVFQYLTGDATYQGFTILS
jgi:hypothetical protein